MASDREDNRMTAPYSHAVRWWVVKNKVIAPFRKITISLVGPAGRDRVAEQLLDIVEVFMPGDYSDLAAGPAQAGRQRAGEIARLALETIDRDLGWRNRQLEAVVEAAAAHEGPYRLVLDRLSKTDRRTGLTFRTAAEVDEAGTRVYVEAITPSGDQGGVTTILSRDFPFDPSFLFDPRGMRITEEALVYVDRHRRAVEEVRRPDRAS